MNGDRPSPTQRFLLRLAGAAILIPYVAVALFGSLFMRPVTLALCVVVLGALGAAVRYDIHRTLGRRPVEWLGPLPAAAIAGLFAPFAKGVEQFGEAGGYLVLLLVVMFTLLSLLWADTLQVPPASSRTASRRAPSTAQPPEPPDPSSSRDLLQALSVKDLIAEWRRSGELLRPSSGAPRHAAAQWREALLEELRRRDPGGFDNWLLDGLQRGPEHHISTDPDDMPGNGPGPLPGR
ncbi:hypothetical protein SAMN05660359_04555 [Geodermatophilus obscurus]|uniref:Uncharacterized protein n=1 Tax=Geodermatophilus obscurus TaxID=1861 RepID=A0A1I5IFR0_9ACTN|nr:hypothetical protein [Geodermatophilus obscurus]SFO59302.1 hypothetical protein SAMN05660359_04555 [Geodermatophilus obscurus]